MRRDQVAEIRARLEEWKELERESLRPGMKTDYERKRGLAALLLNSDLPALVAIVERLAEQRPDLIA